MAAMNISWTFSFGTVCLRSVCLFGLGLIGLFEDGAGEWSVDELYTVKEVHYLSFLDV